MSRAGRALRIGDNDARVAQLRARLSQEYPGAIRIDGTAFDAELDALVRHFQMHHGLAVDGGRSP